jgi:hypothetical protein
VESAASQECSAPFAFRHTHKVSIPREPFPPGTSPSPWAPILTVRTQRCNLLDGPVLPDNCPPSHCKDVSLLDANGTVVGAIRINSTSGVDATDTMLSLVLLSRVLAASRPLNSWEMPEMAAFHADCLPFCLASPQCRAEDRFVPYNFYNVMWFGW